MTYRTARLFIVCALLFVSGCSGCGSGGSSPDTGDPSAAMTGDSPGPQTGLPKTTVRVVNNGGTYNITADVAATDVSRSTGLMYVTYMPEDNGMLFVFDDEQPRSFWMQNTYIQLDMLFLDTSGAIVDINAQAQPQSTTTYTSRAPARYVLEVNGGWCARHGVDVGDSVFIDGY